MFVTYELHLQVRLLEIYFVSLQPNICIYWNACIIYWVFFDDLFILVVDSRLA